MHAQKLKAGLFCIGLDTYWPQFEGLLTRLLGYNERISQKLKTYDLQVTTYGMVDTPQKAGEAAGLGRIGGNYRYPGIIAVHLLQLDPELIGRAALIGQVLPNR